MKSIKKYLHLALLLIFSLFSTTVNASTGYKELCKNVSTLSLSKTTIRAVSSKDFLSETNTKKSGFKGSSQDQISKKLKLWVKSKKQEINAQRRSIYCTIFKIANTVPLTLDNVSHKSIVYHLIALNYLAKARQDGLFEKKEQHIKKLRSTIVQRLNKLPSKDEEYFYQTLYINEDKILSFYQVKKDLNHNYENIYDSIENDKVGEYSNSPICPLDSERAYYYLPNEVVFQSPKLLTCNPSNEISADYKLYLEELDFVEKEIAYDGTDGTKKLNVTELKKELYKWTANKAPKILTPTMGDFPNGNLIKFCQKNNCEQACENFHEKRYLNLLSFPENNQWTVVPPYGKANLKTNRYKPIKGFLGNFSGAINLALTWKKKHSSNYFDVLYNSKESSYFLVCSFSLHGKKNHLTFTGRKQ